jgi:hypothetical protein
MAEYPHNQQDFSGGEVSYDLFFRDNLELHAKSVKEMLNFVPNLQGAAVRAPGTRFVYAVPGSPKSARIIPYIAPTGEQTLVILTPYADGAPGDVELLLNINAGATAPAQSFTYQTINANSSFVDGYDFWSPVPVNYVSRKNNALLGWARVDGALTCQLRRGHDIPNSDPLNGTIIQAVTITADTDHIVLRPDFNYYANYGRSNGVNYGVTIFVDVGTTSQGTDIGSFQITDLQVGGPSYTTLERMDYAFTAGDVIYVYVRVSANAGPGGDGNAVSWPAVRLDDLQILAIVPGDIGSTDLLGTVPYTSAQLKNVQYVQSPYTAVDVLNNAAGKELVTTEAHHPPKRLYLSASYSYEDIFTDDLTQFYSQWNWETNGYPAACTAFSGRLVLAGSVDGTDLSPKGSNSESVWCTEVGDWAKFTELAPEVEVLPTDSVKFDAIYRSPVRWVVGQNILLIGAESVEYTAFADTIFQPGDQGVMRQSTHGSNKVQPVSMGKKVMFPAEAGRRLRAAEFNSDAETSWVAEDLTLVHPRILESGIVRLVRMRNPHQMVVAVLGNGQVGVLSYDETAKVSAWSRLDVGGTVIDAAVLINQGNAFTRGGEDILYFIVKRVIGGVEKLYIESISDWVVGRRWTYLNSYVPNLASTATNVVPGLEHLEGKFVQVVADGNFLGTYEVIDGEVTLVDQFDDPIYYFGVVVGLPSPCKLTTLPLPSRDPGTFKRFTNLTVQTLGSTRPIINGTRPPDRSPLTPLGASQYRDIVGFNKVTSLGAAMVQLVTVEETVPIDLTITRIFGRVTEHEI